MPDPHIDPGVQRAATHRRSRVRKVLSALAGGLLGLAAAQAPLRASTPVAAPAATQRDGAQCRIVRISDIGWADVTATTALFSDVVRDLGYEPRATLLSVPVTYESMQQGNIDVFLGNWMPAQAPIIRPYLQNGSVTVVGANLTGARYTLAVPAYAYRAGLRSFQDIVRFAAQLKHRIYGIEPGNPANLRLHRMIDRDLFGLRGFQLVTSSEAGMLAEVARAVRAHQMIVFLAWEPHPMNLEFHLKYLSGGDAIFGPNYGSATVYTTTRAGYSTQCPNIGRLLRNLKFTVRGETQLMYAILDRHEPPRAAAAAWLHNHPAVVRAWLDGVSTFSGQPGLPAVLTFRGRAHPAARSFQDWVRTHKIPVGQVVTLGINYLKAHSRGVLDAVSRVVRGAVDGLTTLLAAIPSWLLLLALSALSWIVRRSIPLTVFVAAALLFIMNQGYWTDTLQTLSLVVVSAAVSAMIGVPLGIAAAHRPTLNAMLRPVLDLMQTLPTFVYLIPTLVLFGLGVVPGLISTVIFALPAPVRLTQLGISAVPKSLLEAGEAFGATRLQVLWKVELPSAAPTIITGITQCIMLSLSMVVIAALVGAGGLGVPVVLALNTVQIGMGFEAGLVIVLLAIILDRITTRPAAKGPKS
jgi:glycine betaine/proline transport system substrate-binding protein